MEEGGAVVDEQVAEIQAEVEIVHAAASVGTAARSAKVAEAAITTRYTTASKVGAKVGEPTIQTAAIRTAVLPPSSAIVMAYGSLSEIFTALPPLALPARLLRPLERMPLEGAFRRLLLLPLPPRRRLAAALACFVTSRSRRSRLQQRAGQQQGHVGLRRASASGAFGRASAGAGVGLAAATGRPSTAGGARDTCVELPGAL